MSWSVEARPTGWSVTGRLAAPGRPVGRAAESESRAQDRDPTDSVTQGSEATGLKAQEAAAAGPPAQSPRERGPAGAAQCGGPSGHSGTSGSCWAPSR